MTALAIAEDVQARARLSLGRGHDAIHLAVARVLASRDAAGVLADIGCGHGDLWGAVGHQFSRYIGIDAVRYDGLPLETVFQAADFDTGLLPLDDGCADATAAVEVIEHLENPRAFCRELVRITKPHGWVVVTTPNQISVLSLTTLAVKKRFAAFQDSAYPAHRTALLPVDLQRIAAECGLRDVAIHYTGWGRLPLTSWHYPRPLAALWPSGLSDNVVMIGRR
jgi:2-polyprenyl-3-methyl-5-hydroxy-6-metoxy-1,4-benzoquinol methylase